jgi:antitoxin HicB
MHEYAYRIFLREESEGGYTVTVPSLPGCVTTGKMIDEAIANAKEAMELYIESLIAHGDPIPSEERTFEYIISVNAHT